MAEYVNLRFLCKHSFEELCAAKVFSSRRGLVQNAVGRTVSDKDV